MAPAPKVDYLTEVKRYAQNADEKAVAGIVKHLGIALKSADAALVSCSSKDELATVRDSWLKRKLALADADDVLDKSVKEVCEKMKADKNRAAGDLLLPARREARQARKPCQIRDACLKAASTELRICPHRGS